MFELVVQTTEYVTVIGEIPVFIGVIVTVDVVALLAVELHNNVPPAQPVAVKVVDAPLHNWKSIGKLTVGFAVTVTTPVEVAVQLLLFVHVAT
ncbi:hypothetical protein EMA8858_04201 [Emticicia aquatica]|uniref:Uncharacterized protein n=1 Tax=Emticicia aquatica TaxID=1681835 RepID=A0ABN8EZ91_9BACT|nr:hypothetical protein EMA8858_04201 [Emticicia aquatica]